jgi:prepilin-type N-terminal cleavage/methylation domain-containing protein
MTKLLRCPRNRRDLGFSLIEIAVVLVILSILIATVAVPIGSQLNQRRAAETQRSLDLAQQALIGYTSANGRLPCPATDGVTIGPVNSFGDEQFATAADSAVTGKCAYWAGYLPARTLGLSPLDSEGFMVDAWGLRQNRIRYAVWGSDVVSVGTAFVLYPFTKTGGMKAATTTDLSDANKRFIFVCQSAPLGTLPTASSAAVVNACGAGVVRLTDKTPVVIYSLGSNAATGGTGTDEAFNVKTTGSQSFAFVSHTPTAGPTNEFDDLVNWLSLNVLFNNMQAAGKLP